MYHTITYAVICWPLLPALQQFDNYVKGQTNKKTQIHYITLNKLLIRMTAISFMHTYIYKMVNKMGKSLCKCMVDSFLYLYAAIISNVKLYMHGTHNTQRLVCMAYYHFRKKDWSDIYLQSTGTFLSLFSLLSPSIPVSRSPEPPFHCLLHICLFQCQFLP